MFKIFFGNKKEAQWGVISCFDGSQHRVGEIPLEIPVADYSSASCVLEALKKNQAKFENRDTSIPCTINGVSLDQVTILDAKKDYAVTFGPHCLAIRGEENIDEWFSQINVSNWFLKKSDSEDEPLGPFPFADLLDHSDGQPGDFLAYPEGFTASFPLPLILATLDYVPAPPSKQNEEKDETEGEKKSNQSSIKIVFNPPAQIEVPPAPPSSIIQSAPSPKQESQKHSPTPVPVIPPETFSVNSEHGELTCPTCWLRFDKGDIMHIAEHEKLRGDPVLGSDAQQRFYATHFNDRMQALDAMGVPCSDIACPHCRRRLPFGFLDTPHIIFSIVGAPSAGKSYYLSVLIKELQSSLHRNFRIIFKDSDPTSNALLNEMKNHLFGSHNPEQAALIKTQLEGVMYERLPRYGRIVALPKPFIYDLGLENNPRSTVSIVFYDNAGEHFEPGINTQDSPGAQHVAASSGLFFLFDPTANTEFRKKLLNSNDPQLTFNQRFDQQDIILSETEVRIKNLLGMSSTDRIDPPLAVMIGKCDVWLGQIGPDYLSPVVVNGTVSKSAVDANSVLLRNMLLDISPSIVTNAEAISQNVRYFAVSSLGHSPIKLHDGRLAPDPNQIKPAHIDEPTLWVLSQIFPDLVPQGE